MCTRNQAFEILKSIYHACDPILGHSIHDAILYGSYARGDFTAESDIDILLTADLTQEQIASQQRAVSGFRLLHGKLYGLRCTGGQIFWRQQSGKNERLHI